MIRARQSSIHRTLGDSTRRAMPRLRKPAQVRGDWIKPGATVIDVAINRFRSRRGETAPGCAMSPFTCWPIVQPENGSWQPVVTGKAKHSHWSGTDPATLRSSPIG